MARLERGFMIVGFGVLDDDGLILAYLLFLSYIFSSSYSGMGIYYELAKQWKEKSERHSNSD